MLRSTITNTPKAIKQARWFRNNSTKPEKMLWQKLRKSQLGYKFRRQAPLGPYVVDFLCVEKMLIVEVDGLSHHEGKQLQHDRNREAYLQNHGFKTFTNEQIKENTASVTGSITKELNTPPPRPLPAR